MERSNGDNLFAKESALLLRLLNWIRSLQNKPMIQNSSIPNNKKIRLAAKRQLIYSVTMDPNSKRKIKANVNNVKFISNTVYVNNSEYIRILSLK